MRETESGCIPDIGYQEGWFAVLKVSQGHRRSRGKMAKIQVLINAP